MRIKAGGPVFWWPSLALPACSSDPEALKREHLRRGQETAAQKKYPEALLEYDLALQVDPKFGEAFLAMGEVALSS